MLRPPIGVIARCTPYRFVPAILILCSCALGQTGTLTGRVTACDGSGMGGQLVRIQRVDIRGEYTVRTAGNGAFFHAGLPLGEYTVTTELSSGEILQRQGIRTRLGADVPVDLAFVPAIRGVVDIFGERPQVDYNGWFTVFGNCLAERTRTWQGGDLEDGRPAERLDGIGIKVGSVRGYPRYVSSSQIDFFIFARIPLMVTAPVCVEGPAGRAVCRDVEPLRGMPSVSAPFLINGKRHVEARFEGETALVGRTFGFEGSDQRPARPGDAIELLALGLGRTNPDYGVGITLEPAAVTEPVTVTIGGAPAQVTFAGLIPATFGFYRIAVIVPAGIGSGDAPIEVCQNRVCAPGPLFLRVRTD